MFDDKQQVRFVDQAVWDAWGPENHAQIMRYTRAAEQVPRSSPARHVDTLISRGPGVWHAAMTLKTGLFVVSRALISRADAKRELVQAKRMMGLVLRVVDVEGLWYGNIRLHVFDKEIEVFEGKGTFVHSGRTTPLFGPHLSEQVGWEDVMVRAKAFAQEIGMPNLMSMHTAHPRTASTQN